MKVFFVAINGKPWWTRQHVDAMRAVGWKPYLFLGPPERFLPEAKNFNPDLLFYFKHPQVIPEWIEELRAETNCRFVQFNGDQRYYFIREIWNNRSLLDMVLINNSAEQEWYEANGFARCREWHIGVDPRIHRSYDVEEEFDVAFGGNNYSEFPLTGERRRLVYAFDEELKLLTIGNWETRHNLPWISDESLYCQTLSKAKITLGINSFDVPNYYNRRLWLCLAIGRLHLTRYIPNMERDFENHRHLVWFFSIEEALELARYYLRHDKERERIAKEGQRLVFERHTWRHRYEELDGMLEREGLKRRKP